MDLDVVRGDILSADIFHDGFAYSSMEDAMVTLTFSTYTLWQPANMKMQENFSINISWWWGGGGGGLLPYAGINSPLYT